MYTISAPRGRRRRCRRRRRRRGVLRPTLAAPDEVNAGGDVSAKRRDHRGDAMVRCQLLHRRHHGIERDGRSPTSQPGVEKERVSSFLGSDGKAMFSGRRRLQYLSQTVPIPIAEK